MNHKRLTIHALLIVSLIGLATAPAAAQQTETADYYNETSTDTDSDTWLSGLTDATLDDVLTLALRVGAFFIGDAAAQGGVGSAGALLTGLMLAGVMGSVGMRAGAGSAGGLVIGIAAGGAFLTVGIGATWAYPVVLFVVGLLVAAVLLSLLR